MPTRMESLMEAGAAPMTPAPQPESDYENVLNGPRCKCYECLLNGKMRCQLVQAQARSRHGHGASKSPCDPLPEVRQLDFPGQMLMRAIRCFAHHATGNRRLLPPDPEQAARTLRSRHMIRLFSSACNSNRYIR